MEASLWIDRNQQFYMHFKELHMQNIRRCMSDLHIKIQFLVHWQIFTVYDCNPNLNPLQTQDF